DITQEHGRRKRLIEGEDQGLSRRRWITQESEFAWVEDLLLEVGWAEAQLLERFDGQAVDRQWGLGGDVADGDDRGEDAPGLQAFPAGWPPAAGAPSQSKRAVHRVATSAVRGWSPFCILSCYALRPGPGCTPPIAQGRSPRIRPSWTREPDRGSPPVLPRR